MLFQVHTVPRDEDYLGIDCFDGERVVQPSLSLYFSKYNPPSATLLFNIFIFGYRVYVFPLFSGTGKAMQPL